MKKLSLIILALLAVLVSCKKAPEVNLKYVDVEREVLTIGTTTATFQCDYQYIATLKSVKIYYGIGESGMSSKEMQVVSSSLYTEITGLEGGTTYKYYYEFDNGYNSMQSETKQFTTDSTPGSNVPEGAINGLFTINENGDQVYFSKGNLQYQASTNTWRFAENQWSFVGGIDPISGLEFGNVYENGVKSDNVYISSTYTGWIDLFGWGTSGYNHGAVCYRPWSNSLSDSDYYAYGSYTYNLFDLTGQADWGYNAISNGENQSNKWRTPTFAEWTYVYKTRSTTSGIRYAKAQVNGVNGLILLPDNWSSSHYSLNNTNDNFANYASNTITEGQWNILERHGAVFLPAAGWRNKTACLDVGIGTYWLSTYYWLSTNISSSAASGVSFSDSYFTVFNCYRHGGRSVRLVQDVE